MYCNVGLRVVTDSWVQNCWFCRCHNAIEPYKFSEQAKYCNINISDTWADQLSGHFIASDELTTITVLCDDVWIDMVDESAFYFPNSIMRNSFYKGRIGRVGMCYADLPDADRTLEIAGKADIFYVKQLYNSTLDITIGLTTLTLGNRPNAESISRVISVSTNIMQNNVITCPYYATEKIIGYGFCSDTKIISKDGYCERIRDQYYATALYMASVLPTNTAILAANYIGKKFLYVGNTNQYLTKGGIYECQEVIPSTDPATYHWVLISSTDADPSTDIDFSDIEGV